MKEQKLTEAIKLLEQVYYQLYIGAKFDGKDLTLLEDYTSKNKIYDFIKSTGRKTHLKRIKIDYKPMLHVA